MAGLSVSGKVCFQTSGRWFLCPFVALQVDCQRLDATVQSTIQMRAGIFWIGITVFSTVLQYNPCISKLLSSGWHCRCMCANEQALYWAKNDTKIRLWQSTAALRAQLWQSGYLTRCYTDMLCTRTIMHGLRIVMTCQSYVTGVGGCFLQQHCQELKLNEHVNT